MSRNKKIILILLFIFSVSISFVIGYIVALIDTAMPYENIRPSIVPETAFWVGGLDGGNYIELKKSNSDPINIYDANIYYDYEICELQYSGKLEINNFEKDFNYSDVNVKCRGKIHQ
ncbi:MAG: hypothetical protein ACI9RG_000999 [Sulfurimonas sp.]|jgi:hypothetical protein